LTGERLELLITDDTPEWLPGIEPGLRVSSLPTGCFAGPVGSTIDRRPGRPVPHPLVVEHVRVHRRRDAPFG
jgi:hypothetical protein